MEEEKYLLENEKASLQSTDEKIKAMKEEDVLLQEAQEEATWEQQLWGTEEKVRELLKTEIPLLWGTVRR